MKKITQILFFFSAFYSFAQFTNNNIIDYGEPIESFLSYPDNSSCLQLIPAGTDLLDGNTDNTIFYGKTPVNSTDKPVLVFLHGYSSNSEAFTTGCDNMYSDVYNAGYRSVYLSATPNQHMWTNGSMVNRMIDKVTEHYNVDTITLIGWSKGGVDLDAAVTHFGALDKVDKVISLSSPHYGTWLAELSHSWTLSFVNLFFQTNNDASRSLQRGYMNYFREITNGKPTPQWYTVGAWGDGPLARVSIPQSLLYINGGSKESGGNDGVVPYASSKRPNGTELYSGQYFVGWGFLGYYTGPSETNLDHFEITQGKYSWPIINDIINNNNSAKGKSIEKSKTLSSYFPNDKVVSTGQIIIADGSPITLEVEKAAHFNLSILSSVENKTAKKINSKLNVYQENYSIEKPKLGNYTISPAKGTVLVLNILGGVEATLSTGLSAEKLVYKVGEKPKMNIKISNNLKASYNGIMALTTNLDASKVENVLPEPLTFVQKGNAVVIETIPFTTPGIYDFTIQVNGDGFNKTIHTTIAVVSKKGEVINSPIENTLQLFNAYPNPVEETLHLQLSVENELSGTIQIFNVFGRLVDQINIKKLEKGTHTIDHNFNKLSSGTYILRYEGKEGKQTEIIIKK